MRRRIIHLCGLFLLFFGLLSTSAAGTPSASARPAAPGPADFPTVSPDYIYDQLAYMATHFQRREAGYDTNLPVTVNGHDEFANYWSQEMTNDLQDFHPQVQRDSFPVQGWAGRKATTPAFNVEVSVPGLSHAEQVVVLGCHYDGEASSTQSANDDGSGCAIELGVAKAMADYWRSHHLYPARTLRFVIFDAEEQGLFGSFHYLDQTINGDRNNVVAMFNEEQNGIAYPLHYQGMLNGQAFPFYVDLSPLQNNQLYPHQDQLTTQQRAQITEFRTLMQQAVPAVFQQFYALGYQRLTYHDNTNHDVYQPIFTPDQTNQVQQEDDTLGSSDQVPFTMAGVPSATFVGNSSYYGGTTPAYPYDQPQDTIQLMNTFANGSSHKAQALTLSLALPGMLTTWMLHQPAILGEDAWDQKPLASISDIGPATPNSPLALNAKTAFDPQNGPLSYHWDFGDGTQATGVNVNHTYTSTGTYPLTLTVSSGSHTRSVTKNVSVVTQLTTFPNDYAGSPQDGRPPTNNAVALPQPNDNLTDRVAKASTANVTPPIQSQTTQPLSVGLIILISLIVLLALGLLIGLLLFISRTQRHIKGTP